MKNHKTTSLVCVAASCLLLAALPTTPPHKDLLGKSPDEVIQQHGVPDMASASATHLKFSYRDAEGNQADFFFHDDCAVKVPAPGFQPAKVTAPPAGKVYAGQKVTSAVGLLGNPRKTSVGSNAIQLTYPNGQSVMLQHGRVFPTSR